jgi:hypothetical protein
VPSWAIFLRRKDEMSTQPSPASPSEDWISEPDRGLTPDSARLREIRATLDERGLAELPGFLTSAAQALLKEQILALESAAAPSTQGGNRKFSIKGDKLSETVVGQLAHSAFMHDFVNNLLGAVDGRPALVDPPIRSDEIIHGISLMRGPGDVTAHHTDGSYLNLIFPVMIPKLLGDRRGQLVISPNARSFKKSLWTTKVVPALLRVRVLRRLFERRDVDYQEDTVYAFNGYRSYHGVESPAESALRCITNMTVGQPRFR